ncbi:MAG: dihydroorotase [Bacteroidales bacterium]|nr:dihydroorotase [Bacteroidales bacterium]
MEFLIQNITIVNEGKSFEGSVLISDGMISKITRNDVPMVAPHATVIDGRGRYLIPGIIDEHVHFREPGMTAKADIWSESRAAVAGGVTSVMEMPNTVPQTTTQALLQEKFDLAAERSLANYSFYLGATHDNLQEVSATDPAKVCGIKLFMGSSTGNMLVDDDSALKAIFQEAPCLIAAHCEEEEIIRNNTQHYQALVKEGSVQPTANLHPLIRTAEACYRSSAKAAELAAKTGARLHIMHISTQRELSLFSNNIDLTEKKITAETCPHYLLFDDTDYDRLGFAIKCNPAIKTADDRQALREALCNGLIDTIGSDHAPHLREEKFTDNYFTAKSGFPSIQHTLPIMMRVAEETSLTMEQLVQRMCHNPAILYQIDRRGFIREGYHADLAIVDIHADWQITPDSLHYKCGWTPYVGQTVHTLVTHTFVNGNLVFENGEFHDEHRGERLAFRRS